MADEAELTVGNFTLNNCIATGNTTQIWEVTEQGVPMPMAMKLLLEDAHKDNNEKAILKHEFKVGKSLEHPGFLRFHQLEVNRDHGFFTMDFMRAPSLKQQMSSSLPGLQSSVGKLAETLCRALQYLHDQGWLHRDIKPDNILVDKSGDAKIIDFSLTTRMKKGIGKLLAGKQVIRGTRNYIAPETILKKPGDARTDQYSLGVTLYEIVTGNLPFAGSTPSDLLKKHVGEKPAPPTGINPNLTPELEAVLLKMLAKKPGDRYDSMQEVGSALHGIRCFIEDPQQLHEQMLREEKERQTMSVDKRLDSRADAERTAKGIKSPAKPKKKALPASVLREQQRIREQEAAKAAEPAPAAPAPAAPYPGMPGYQMPGQPMPGMMPGMMPGQPMPGQVYPGQPMPGQMYPGQPMPGQPMPGQPMPGQMYPGQPMPGQMPPGQPMPGQPMPGQMPPAQPVPGQPVPGQPVQGQPVPGQHAPGQPAPVQPAPAQPPQQPAPPAAPPAAETATDATEDDVKGLMDMIE